MTHEVTVLARGLNFPEGPAFAPDGTLWCVEARGGALVQWSAAGVVRHDSGGLPCGLAFDAQGRAWFCDAKQKSVRVYDPAQGRFDTVATSVNGVALNAPNDLAFDAAGNLVFSCPGDSRFEPTGSVCCLRPDGTVKTLHDALYFPNGIVFGADNRTLYVAETYGKRVWKGAWNAAAATWTNAAPWAGRLFLGSSKMAAMSPGPGTVLPSLVHGGPGRAGGGEELGGQRGLQFYMQRTALEGDASVLKSLIG